MKALRTILTAIVLLAGAMTMNAQRMSIAAMQSNARFLTDRMAYTLGVRDPYLIDEIYRINYDYIWGVNDYLDDVALGYYYDDYMAVCAARDAALRNLLGYTIWNRLIGYNYFYRPIVFVNRGWHFSIYDYDHYGPRHYFYSVPRPLHGGYAGGHFFRGMAPRGGRHMGPNPGMAPRGGHVIPAPRGGHVGPNPGMAPRGGHVTPAPRGGHVGPNPGMTPRGGGHNTPAPGMNRGGAPAPNMNHGNTPAPNMNRGNNFNNNNNNNNVNVNVNTNTHTHQGSTPDMNRGGNMHNNLRSGSNMNSSSRQTTHTNAPTLTNASMNTRGSNAGATMNRGSNFTRGGAGTSPSMNRVGTRSGGAMGGHHGGGRR